MDHRGSISLFQSYYKNEIVQAVKDEVIQSMSNIIITIITDNVNDKTTRNFNQLKLILINKHIDIDYVLYDDFYNLNDD